MIKKNILMRLTILIYFKLNLILIFLINVFRNFQISNINLLVVNLNNKIY